VAKILATKAQRHEATQRKFLVNLGALVSSWRDHFLASGKKKKATSLSADRDAQIKECGRGGATSKTYLDNKIYLCIRDKELSSSICLC
jgi:hypothetical protein